MTRTTLAIAACAVLATGVFTGGDAKAQFHESAFGSRVRVDNQPYVGGPDVVDANAQLLKPSVTGYGTVNSKEGKLHAAVSTAERGPNGCHPFFCGYAGRVEAFYWDVVTLHYEGDEDYVDIPMGFAFTGNLDQGDFGGASAQGRYYMGKDPTGWNNQGIDLRNGGLNVSQTVRIRRNRLEPYFFYGYLNVSARGGGISDFGNTLTFNWDLPEGVTFTSASGQFMTGQTAAVPEPATWAMMLTGFFGLGSCLRISRARQAAGVRTAGRG